MANVLHVVGAAGASASDAAMASLLTTAGHTVTQLSETSLTGTSFDAYDAGIISDSASSSTVGTTGSTTTKPILICDDSIARDWGLSTGFLAGFSDNDCYIQSPSSPFANGMSGAVVVYTANVAMRGSATANLGAGVTVLATRGTSSTGTTATYFYYAQGATLADTTAAAGHRAFYTNRDGTWASLNSDGQGLFTTWVSTVAPGGASQQVVPPAAEATADAVAPEVGAGAVIASIAGTSTASMPAPTAGSPGADGYAATVQARAGRTAAIGIAPTAIGVRVVNVGDGVFLTPPGATYAPRHPLFQYFPITSGLTVLKIGDSYQSVHTPTDEQLAAADAVYLGGHYYTIPAEEVAALTAAGYGAYIDAGDETAETTQTEAPYNPEYAFTETPDGIVIVDPVVDPGDPPAQVTGLTAATGDTLVSLTWNAAAEAEGYQVYRNGVLVATRSVPNYADTDVVNGITYSYTVVAFNDNGTGLASSATLATPQADVVVPPPVITPATVVAAVAQATANRLVNGHVIDDGTADTSDPYAWPEVTTVGTLTYNVVAGEQAAALQAALNNAVSANKTLFITGGIADVRGRIRIPNASGDNRPHIVFDTGAGIRQLLTHNTGSPQGTLCQWGSLGATLYTVTGGSTARGSKTVVLNSVADLAVGDWLWMYSTQNTADGKEPTNQTDKFSHKGTWPGFLRRIEDIDGTTVTLDKEFHRTSRATMYANKAAMPKGAFIEGGVVMQAKPLENRYNLVHFMGVDSPYWKNGELKDSGASGLKTVAIWRGRFDMVIHDMIDDTSNRYPPQNGVYYQHYGYGVEDNSARETMFRLLEVYRCRHSYTTNPTEWTNFADNRWMYHGEPEDVRVILLDAHDMWSTGYNTHESGWNVSVEGFITNPGRYRAAGVGDPDQGGGGAFFRDRGATIRPRNQADQYGPGGLVISGAYDFAFEIARSAKSNAPVTWSLEEAPVVRDLTVKDHNGSVMLAAFQRVKITGNVNLIGPAGKGIDASNADSYAEGSVITGPVRIERAGTGVSGASSFDGLENVTFVNCNTNTSG